MNNNNKIATKSISQLMSQVDTAVKSNNNNNNNTDKVPQVKVISTPNKVEDIQNTVSQTDSQGYEVVKPSTAAVDNFMKKESTTKNTIDMNVSRMQTLIDDYVKFNTGTIMKSEQDKQKAGKKFRDILLFSLEHPTPQVLDAMYRFFRKHKDKILAPKLVLPTTLSLSSSIAEKINCIYTLFKMITDDNKNARVNSITIRMLLGNTPTSKVDALLMYVEQKLNNK